MFTTVSADPAIADAVLGPLLGAVRHRHPDVDIVVLPERLPPAVPPHSADLEEAVALARRGRTALADLAAAAQVAPAGIVSLWWRQGPDGSHRHVTRATFVDLAPATGSMELLDRVRRHLTDAGWRVTALLEPRPRLTGEQGPLALRAEGYPTAVEVEVTTTALVLDEPTLDALAARERAAR